MFRITLILLASSWIFPIFANSEDGWVKVKEKDGVVVYEKEIGDRTAFRGVAILEGTPEKLVGILHNTERWRYWIEDLDEGRELERISPFHAVYYQAIDTLFPASNRDLVFESVITREADSSILIKMRSIEHPLAPETVGVRAALLYTSYKIEPLPENRMKVVFENLSDPGGRLPNFLVDWASKSYPISLIQGLQKEMMESAQKKASLPE
ncbi:MAG: hypothetical protein CBC00_10345 [Verrucomicrobia bacterium TMED40]|nr:MAG: hypothetical protein CBC00_10345 [Verrucomicrobia bacterium TMED40]|tara:strand:- start:1576 stop:2205 length:630 start_codon:yes stop_codon:yes gene_type:complete